MKGGWDRHRTHNRGLPYLSLPYLRPLSLCPQPRRAPARPPALRAATCTTTTSPCLLPFSSSSPVPSHSTLSKASSTTPPRPKVPVANLQHWQVCAGLGRPLLSITFEEFTFLDLYFLLPSIHCLSLTHTYLHFHPHPHLSTWTLDLGRSLGNQNTTSSSPCFCAPQWPVPFTPPLTHRVLTR